MSINPSTEKESSARIATLFLVLCLSSENAIRSQRGVVTKARCAELKTEAIRWADEIVVLAVDAPTTRIAEAAIDRWERCEEYEIAFPRFVLGSGNGRRVRVHIEERLPGLGQCGFFAGETITIHRLVLVDNERIDDCPPPDRILAHELGHVLGLQDVEAPGCPTFIMSEVMGNRPFLQRVGREECRAVDRKWSTSYERDDEASTQLAMGDARRLRRRVDSRPGPR